MSDKSPVILVSGAARAEIWLDGAEWRAWRVGDVDLLWTPDGVHWDAVAPVLFPVCGWTRGGGVRVGGKTYPLGLHGFARFEHFEIIERGVDHARLALRDNAATRAIYPFAFELVLSFRLSGYAMTVEARVHNSGIETLPYAIGFHPGFRWPFGDGEKMDHAIHFDRAETPEVPVIAPGGLFSSRRRPVDFIDPRTLPLSDATFEREALCFLGAASAALDFVSGEGRGLRVENKGFANFVLWSRPGAPFLCIESWTGFGDPEAFEGELADKPGMILLPPSGVGRHVVTYTACLSPTNEGEGCLLGNG